MRSGDLESCGRSMTRLRVRCIEVFTRIRINFFNWFGEDRRVIGETRAPFFSTVVPKIEKEKKSSIFSSFLKMFC